MAKNYFDLLNAPISFSLNLADLNAQYLALQRATHPDRYAGGSEREQLIAQQRAAEVNDAYQTLKSPLLRAQYLLELMGVSMNVDATTVKDPQLLMQQMMWRERLDDLGSQPDMGDLDSLSQEIQAELNVIEVQLVQSFDPVVTEACHSQRNELAMVDTDTDEVRAIQKLVLNMQFMSKLQQTIRDVERRLLETM